MKTKYTYKQIWTIAYPILISLIMEQLQPPESAEESLS